MQKRWNHNWHFPSHCTQSTCQISGLVWTGLKHLGLAEQISSGRPSSWLDTSFWGVSEAFGLSGQLALIGPSSLCYKTGKLRESFLLLVTYYINTFIFKIFQFHLFLTSETNAKAGSEQKVRPSPLGLTVDQPLTCIYPTCVIITRSWFETEDFFEEFAFLVNELSAIRNYPLFNINRSEKWGKKYTSRGLQWRAYSIWKLNYIYSCIEKIPSVEVGQIFEGYV